MPDITDIIKDKVIKICEAYEQKTGDDEMRHIKSVVDISGRLAGKFGADKEITVLSAYLHDISEPSEYGDRDDHHIYSAELAGKMLAELNYPADKIERVKKCVLHHRGSKMMAKESVEEECVADADAISHFYSLPGLFQVAYGPKGLTTEQGREWVRKKLENDLNKLSQKSRDLYKSRYDLIVEALFGGDYKA